MQSIVKTMKAGEISGVRKTTIQGQKPRKYQYLRRLKDDARSTNRSKQTKMIPVGARETEKQGSKESQGEHSSQQDGTNK